MYSRNKERYAPTVPVPERWKRESLKTWKQAEYGMTAQPMPQGSKPFQFMVLMAAPKGLSKSWRTSPTASEKQDALRRANFCIEQAADSILWIDPEGKIAFANQKACEVLEYSKDELQALTVFDIDPMITREWWRPHWEAIREKKAFIIETCHRTKSGQIFPVEVGVNYMTFEGNEYNCVFARDIRGRKEAEKQLAHFSAIMDSSHDAIIGKSLDGIVTSWNPGAEQLYGYSAAEMIGQPISTLTPHDRADEIEALLARLKDGGACGAVRYRPSSQETAIWSMFP